MAERTEIGPELDLSDGFALGEIDGATELVFDGTTMTSYDLNLRPTETVPAVASAMNCPLAFESRRSLLYFSDGDLKVIKLRTGEVRVLYATGYKERRHEFEERLKAGRGGPDVVKEALRRHPGGAVNWLLEVSPDGEELLILLVDLPESRVLRLGASGDVLSEFSVCVPSGVGASYLPPRICFPNAKEGPTLLDHQGERVKVLPSRRLGERRYVGGLASSLRQNCSLIAIGGIQGLWLWEPDGDSVAELEVSPENLAYRATWSSDGDRLWFCRGSQFVGYAESGETWRIRPIAQIRREHRGEQFSWCSPPLPSPCGRYLLVRFTYTRPPTAEEERRRHELRESRKALGIGKDVVSRDLDDEVPSHLMAVFDLEAKKVATAPGFAHNAAWIRSATG